MRATLPRQLRIRTYASRLAYPTSAPVQRPLRAAYYRGGTSRALIINPHHLPPNRTKWPGIFQQIMGSGDPYGRQLDGMGAGISSLSKICLVEPHGETLEEILGRHKNSWGIDESKSRLGQGTHWDYQSAGDPHVDYTFVGMGIESPEVDVAGNCGNMSSAIGPYAYNAGLLPPSLYGRDGMVTVRIRNTNTKKLIDSTFHVVGGQAATQGEYAIDGVAGTGSKIKLDFLHPYGSKTGKLLPTGNKVDTIAGYKVTCVDGPNPAVFVRAADIGVPGTILPEEFNKLADKLELLETIRSAAAVAMGVATSPTTVPRTIPKIGIVSMSATHPVLSGAMLKASQTDLVVRFISDGQPHRAIPLTAALTTALAARIPGSVVEQLLAPEPVVDDAITIGHASGRLQVNAKMDPSKNLAPLSASVYRTAKRLFEGTVFATWTDDAASLTSTSSPPPASPALGMAFVTELREGKTNSHDSEPTPRPQDAHPQTDPTPPPLPPSHFTTPAVAPDPTSLHPHHFTKINRFHTPEKGREWHRWAKRLAEKKKPLREAAKRSEETAAEVGSGPGNVDSSDASIEKGPR